jgi:Mrp family chromosome partitioning ATPase
MPVQEGQTVPTDISTPNWRCNICGSVFGDDHDRAAFCEAAGPPVTLADGELYLDYRDPRSFSRGGYTLAKLIASREIQSPARFYPDRNGHDRVYEVARPGATAEQSRPRVKGSDLWPHDPHGHWLNLLYAGGAGIRGLRLEGPRNGGRGTPSQWATAVAELIFGQRAQPGEPGSDFTAPVRVLPITAAVAAIFQMLGVVLDPPRHRAGPSVIAAERAAVRDGLPEGHYDPHRAAWYLSGASADDIRAEIASRQRRWIRGEAVTVPMPSVHATRRKAGSVLSYSKLTSSERVTVAAAGVEWRPRYGADDYLRDLLQQALGVPMTSDADLPSQMFATPEDKVAVTSTKGGVGKSTLAAAFSVAAARAGRNVLLIDVNLPNPAQHLLFGLGPVATIPEELLIVPSVIEDPGSRGRLAVFSHAQLAMPGSPVALIDASHAREWISFLAGNLDLRGVDLIVFDMPPGWDDVHKVVMGGSGIGLTASLHVTTGHRLAVGSETTRLPGTDHHQDKTPRFLIENLSRAAGALTDGSGRQAEIRLYGDEAAVQALAAAEGATYAGSLPWAPDPRALAASPEVTQLAAVLAAIRPARADIREAVAARCNATAGNGATQQVEERAAAMEL